MKKFFWCNFPVSNDNKKVGNFFFFNCYIPVSDSTYRQYLKVILAFIQPGTRRDRTMKNKLILTKFRIVEVLPLVTYYFGEGSVVD